MKKFLTFTFLTGLIVAISPLGFMWLSHKYSTFWPEVLNMPPFSEDWAKCLLQAPLKTNYWSICMRAAKNYGFLTNFTYLTIIFWSGVAISILAIFGFFNVPEISQKYIRGPKIHKGSKAFTKLKEATKNIKSDVEIEPLSGWCFTNKDICRHTLILGAVGSGKTVLIRTFLANSDRIKSIALDVKGDFPQDLNYPLPNRKRAKALLLNPFDARSAQWWLGADILNVEESREFATKFLSSGSNGISDFWQKSTGNILVAILLSLIHERGTNWSWSDLAIRIGYSFEQLKVIADKYYPPASQILAMEGNETSNSILINLATDSAHILDIANFWHADHAGKKYSIKYWLSKSKIKQVIIGWDASREIASKAWAGAFLDLCGKHIASPTYQGTHRINLYMDEFAQLPRMDGIIRAIDVGRSKNVAVFIGVQSFSQLKEIYGLRAESFRSLIGNYFFCQMASGQDAKEAADFIGSQTIKERTYSVTNGEQSKSSTVSWQEKNVPLITPDEFGKDLGVLKDGIKLVYHRLGLDFYILKIPFPNVKKFRPAFVPAEPEKFIPRDKNKSDAQSTSQADVKINPFGKLINDDGI